MMRLIIALGFILSLFSITAIAGGDHNHGHSHSNTPATQETAKVNATKIVAAFVKRNILPESWSAIKASSVEKKVFKGNPEWVVIFINDKITNTKKRKLYVFLTLSGRYLAANYTGK